MADVLDVLIVGGGAAGYTAGIFAARDRCRALLLEKFSSGGQVLNCEASRATPWVPCSRSRRPRRASRSR
jgi:thioredoxin reductase (NADPH)